MGSSSEEMTSASVKVTLILTVTDFILHWKKKAFALTGRELPWHYRTGVVEKFLGGWEQANNPSILFT
jgi:hypothetical protein